MSVLERVREVEAARSTNGASSASVELRHAREMLRSELVERLGLATIASMLDQDARVLKDPAYFIAVSSLGDSSVNIVVRAWTSTGDFWSVFFDMNEKVYKQFPIVGLNIPYPQMDVHLHQEGH